MKRIFKPFACLLALSAGVTSFAQNIVVNPGFETYSQCPSSTSQLNKATGWETPTYGSPDFYNTCATVNAGVPDNSFGSQSPATGNGYAGIIPYLVPINSHVEYMEGHLTNMQPGLSYHVSMKVSCSEINAYAMSGLGIFFSVDSVYADEFNSGPLPYIPQVDFSSYGIITDTANWITLTDTFLADSAYKFLTIGCFKDGNLVDVDTVNYGQQPGAYYYIDDVEVIPITTGIGNLASHALKATVYPNPLSTSARVSFGNPQGLLYDFGLYNVQGQKVATINSISGSSFIVERGDLPAGIYYYRLSASDKRDSYTGRLIIE